MEPNPNEDSLNHINIYSRGKTHLGRWLSNFTRSPFKHPEYGHFESMEGFWYWAATGMTNEALRTVWGFKAKEEGKKHTRVKNPKFRSMIKEALICKIKQTKEETDNFVNSKLPFEHYYYYGNVQDHRVKIIVPPSGKMLISLLDEIRRDMKKEK